MHVSQAAAIVEKTLYPVLTDSYDREPAVYPMLCDVLPWDPAFTYGERFKSVGGVGEPDIIEYGTEAPDRSFEDHYTIYSKGRKLAHKITVEKELFAQLQADGTLQPYLMQRFDGAGMRFKQAKEKFIAGIVQKGTLTAGSLTYFDNSFVGETDAYPKYIYDGLPFFDTAHTLKHSSGSTLSNHTASAALSTSTLESALTLMERTSALDERGEPIVNQMDTLVVPAGPLEFPAAVLLESIGKVGTANNDINSVRGRLELVPWRYLTDDADCWFLFRLRSGQRSIRMRDSGAPAIRMWEEPRIGSFVIQAESYFSATVVDWRGAFCANKAAT